MQTRRLITFAAILWCGQQCLVAGQQIEGRIEKNPGKPFVAVTDFRASGGAAALKQELERSQGAPVPIEGPGEADRFLLNGLEDQARAFGLPGARNVTPSRWLREGDTVLIAGRTFDVLHCPGHTPGHLVFICKPERFALVGDVLFQGSVGRTDFPYGDHAALIRGIEQKLLPLGDDIAFVCGHGPGSSFGAERRNNPFLSR